MRFAKLVTLSIFAFLAVAFAHAARAENSLTDTQQATRINATAPPSLTPIFFNDMRLSAFMTDGCSAFYEQAHSLSGPIQACCIEHDFRYWVGGSMSDRAEADKYLRDCVIAETSDKLLANSMYRAVRIFGGPGSGQPFQWGYGWKNSDGTLANMGYVSLRSDAVAPGICKAIEAEYIRKERGLPHPYYRAPKRPMPTCYKPNM